MALPPAGRHGVVVMTDDDQDVVEAVLPPQAFAGSGMRQAHPAVVVGAGRIVAPEVVITGSVNSSELTLFDPVIHA